jgi:hypothetical protein
MDYKQIYNNLISSRRKLNRNKKDGIFESHHVIPKCFGGSDEKQNRVLLTPKEHYFAHLLLTFLYEGKDKAKMCYALLMMTWKGPNVERSSISSRKYDQAVKILRAHCIGKNHPNHGMKYPKWSQASKDKLSKFQMGKSYEDKVGTDRAREWKEKIIQNNLGRKHPHSMETKEHLSKIQAGKSYVDKVGADKAKMWIEKARKSNTGKKRSEEVKEKLRGVNNPWFGRTHSDETKLKMSASKKGMVPHNKNCTVYLQYGLDGVFIKEMLPTEIENIGILPANVIHCANGKRNKAGNFMWRKKYGDEILLSIEPYRRKPKSFCYVNERALCTFAQRALFPTSPITKLMQS